MNDDLVMNSTLDDLILGNENQIEDALNSNIKSTQTKDDKSEDHNCHAHRSLTNNVEDSIISTSSSSIIVNSNESTSSKSKYEPKPVTIPAASNSSSRKPMKRKRKNPPKKKIFNYNYRINYEQNQIKPKIIEETHNNNNEINNLTYWGLPDSVLEKYKSRGVKKMFDWQVECLSNPKVLKYGANLIYSAPTSSGKTLVAEILALKTIFERNKKVLFILPFISIVREKMYYFQDILECSGFRVDGIMGSYNPPGGFDALDLAICTIEKANSLINRLLEDNKLSDIGAILVDEMHLLGDPSRGYLLELLLTKLRYITRKNIDVNIQIIGMSATLPNLNAIAEWLGAELYCTTFRPVPLYEQIVVDNNVYDNKFKLIRNLEASEIYTEENVENVLLLCLETLKDSHSVLIFCPTKNWCEQLAQQLAQAFHKIGNSVTPLGEMLRNQLQSNLIHDVLEQLRYCPVGLDKILSRTVSFGVGFHHAGLTMDERDLIERGFRNGGIRILVATSTLSSGVNLPARRVIIRSPVFNSRTIDILTYRQMIGRAGRLGQDSMGESFLICQQNHTKIVEELVQGEETAIKSCLELSGKLKRAIIEVIACGVVSTQEDLNLFVNSTLLAQTDSPDETLLNPIEESIGFLTTNEFIRLQDVDGKKMYVATSLGKACLSSSMAPDEALTLFTELDKARQCFVLETELHLIYLVTPYSSCYSWDIDWMLFLDLWGKLPPAMKRVGELVGVKEYFIIQGTRGLVSASDAYRNHRLMLHKRFFISLALQDLVNELTLGEVCAKFNCNRGMLQSLQQSAATFAGMVTSFSRKLKWYSVEILLSQFQNRLQFGVSRDLLDLMRLSSIQSRTARTLYDAGIETLVDLANTNVATVEDIFYKATPFEHSKEQNERFEYEKKRNRTAIMWITGREGLTHCEVATILIEAARDFLKLELGLKDANWDTDKQINVTIKEDHQEEKKQEIERSNSVIAIDSTDPPEHQAEPELSLNQSCQLFVTSRDKSLYSKSQEMFTNLETSILEPNLDEVISMHEMKNISKPTMSSLMELDNPVDFIEHNITKATLMLSLDDSPISEKADFDDADQSACGENSRRWNTEQNSSSCLFGMNHDFTKTENADALDQSTGSQDLFFQEEEYSINTNAMQHEVNPDSSHSSISNISLTDAVPPKRLKVLEKSTPLCNTPKKLSRESSEESIDWATTEINVIHISTKDDALASFFCDLKNKKCFSLEIIYSDFDTRPQIGGKLLGRVGNELDTSEKEMLSYNGKRIDGMTICWGKNHIYYLSIKNVKMCRKITILLQSVLNNRSTTVIMFDAKEQIKYLKSCLNVEFHCKIEDTKILFWLEDTGKQEAKLWKMAKIYCPELNDALESMEKSNSDDKIMEQVRAVINWQLVKIMHRLLDDRISKLRIANYSLPNAYELETKLVMCLANMEIIGVNVSKTYLKNLATLLKQHLQVIEKTAASLVCRKINFNSPSDVMKALGNYNGKKQSSKKYILEQSKNPIAELTLQWRKIHFTLTNIIIPLITYCQNDKLHCNYITSTVTGRITMHEPNIQMVPKKFTSINPISKELIEINCRNAFKASDRCLLISADYCQLELRVLTYLSKDELLLSIMNQREGDIFRSIAAKWNKVLEIEVDDDMRQRTKQLCYSIIYGRGAKSLSEQLNVEVSEATSFMESFRNTYTGMQDFIKEIVEFCEKNGYVETITGRRRYLPKITDENLASKKQAERQAVNTTIQGSAADIVKNAMIIIEEQLNAVFNTSKSKPVLIIHLHDELIFEVREKYLNKVINIIKEGMEKSGSAFGYFPIKIKTGKSWGELIEFQCD